MFFAKSMRVPEGKNINPHIKSTFIFTKFYYQTQFYMKNIKNVIFGTPGKPLDFN